MGAQLDIDDVCANSLVAEAELEKLRAGIRAVRMLMNESSGVAGLHLNGDIAPWGSLEEGGDLETWLREFNSAEAV